MNSKYTLKEIEDKFGIPVTTMRNWIKKGIVVAGKGDPFNKSVVYVTKENFLNIPTYIRNRYKNDKTK